ncbi:hypothetical protein RKD23_004334 [Streptomyces sp. SAI-170]
MCSSPRLTATDTSWMRTESGPKAVRHCETVYEIPINR